MERLFDTLAKSLAESKSRRQLLQWFSGGVVATLLPFRPTNVHAQSSVGEHHRACTQFCRQLPPHFRAQCLTACFACSGGVGGICGPSGAVVCCPAGTTCCEGACTDTSIDPQNCGTCGQVCASGMCVNGTCQSGCPPPLVQCCQGTVCECVNIFGTDPFNCGGCGFECAPGSVCVGGTCIP
jgi:hypothetical protein